LSSSCTAPTPTEGTVDNSASTLLKAASNNERKLTVYATGAHALGGASVANFSLAQALAEVKQFASFIFQNSKTLIQIEYGTNSDQLRGGAGRGRLSSAVNPIRRSVLMVMSELGCLFASDRARVVVLGIGLSRATDGYRHESGIIAGNALDHKYS